MEFTLHKNMPGSTDTISFRLGNLIANEDGSVNQEIFIDGHLLSLPSGVSCAQGRDPIGIAENFLLMVRQALNARTEELFWPHGARYEKQAMPEYEELLAHMRQLAASQKPSA